MFSLGEKRLIYVQSAYFFIFHDGRLPNDHEVTQEI